MKLFYLEFVKGRLLDIINRNKEKYTLRIYKTIYGGDFSFLEYNADISPYCDPLYEEFQKNYLTYKSIMRKAFVNWIYKNLIGEENIDERS